MPTVPRQGLAGHAAVEGGVNLWRACGFDLSLVVWGYDLAGDAAEVSALVVEMPTDVRWDHDQAYLNRFGRWRDGQRVPTPEWWALPYVVDAEVAA